jgi:hypothetical protein
MGVSFRSPHRYASIHGAAVGQGFIQSAKLLQDKKLSNQIHIYDRGGTEK